MRESIENSHVAHEIAEIAAELHVSHQRVQFILAKALKKLHLALERKGIKDAKDIRQRRAECRAGMRSFIA